MGGLAVRLLGTLLGCVAVVLVDCGFEIPELAGLLGIDPGVLDSSFCNKERIFKCEKILVTTVFFNKCVMLKSDKMQ